MASITQKSLFCWEDIDELGDLKRLELVMRHIDDENLMAKLEKERGLRGRREYPIRAMWNSLLAKEVFQHKSIESLRRELSRNAQLRQMCGFNPAYGERAVPKPWVYTRFLRKLMKYQDMIVEITVKLDRKLRRVLPGYGENLAMDGKAIQTHARYHRKEDRDRSLDGRRDIDADIGVKTYVVEREDGSRYKKEEAWYGYKLHLLVDADYELPVAFEVTKASASEVKQAHRLIDKLKESRPEVLDQCEYLTADRGYDDGKLIEKLWKEYHIKPVIDIRNSWRDGEETKLLPGTENIVYDYKGRVYCHPMGPGPEEQREMAYAGFEESRETLKYRCPAQHYGLKCSCSETCPARTGIRIKMQQDPRLFTPVARSSYKWDRIYDTRTSVERVNSRIDVCYGYEDHYIRGLAKMKMSVSITIATMLAMALGRVKEKRGEHLRSLVKAA
jgi:hypothetical protein